MSPIFLLVHGWGFGASFFDPLIERLGAGNCVAWDLGFGGTANCPPLPPGRSVVAVGHSFGYLWLLHERPCAWRAIVSINGFSRFTGGLGFPQGVAPRLLTRMIRQLEKEPGEVRRQFLERCGAADDNRGTFDPDRLAWGLRALELWDCREAGSGADLVLAGRSDPICPAGMTEALFGQGATAWHEGGHLLPRTAPDWCAERLQEMAERI